MYFHASPVKGIKILEPRVSNHGMPLIYFSKKRENVLVYLSNAIEKYCKETGFDYSGKWMKWGPYGFNKDGTQRIEGYYPNALVDTYRGISGYIYVAEDITDSGFQVHIPDAATSSKPVLVRTCEFVPDAYEAILAAEKEGLITILRYEESSQAQLEWIERIIRQEYEEAIDRPEYRHFQCHIVYTPISNSSIFRPSSFSNMHFCCIKNLLILPFIYFSKLHKVTSKHILMHIQLFVQINLHIVIHNHINNRAALTLGVK